MIRLNDFHFSFPDSEPIKAAALVLQSSVGVSRLMEMALAVESDLQRFALDFIFATRAENAPGVHAAIAGAVALDAAWHRVLEDLSIPRAAMAESAPPRHHAVKSLLQLADGEEDEKTVRSMQQEIHKSLQASLNR